MCLLTMHNLLPFTARCTKHLACALLSICPGFDSYCHWNEGLTAYICFLTASCGLFLQAVKHHHCQDLESVSMLDRMHGYGSCGSGTQHSPPFLLLLMLTWTSASVLKSSLRAESSGFSNSDKAAVTLSVTFNHWKNTEDMFVHLLSGSTVVHTHTHRSKEWSNTAASKLLLTLMTDICKALQIQQEAVFCLQFSLHLLNLDQDNVIWTRHCGKLGGNKSEKKGIEHRTVKEFF